MLTILWRAVVGQDSAPVRSCAWVCSDFPLQPFQNARRTVIIRRPIRARSAKPSSFQPRGPSMSSVVTKRHALGLPAGSVRAAHVLILVAMVCLAILMPSATILPVPPYLIYLLLLGLGHFFAAHGHTIRAPGTDHSPLYMPAGCVRFLVLLALVGAIGWKFYSDPD